MRALFTVFFALSLLTGIAYPLVVTGFAQTLLPHQASGSLIERDGKTVGSTLLAQGFSSPRYFHPRPSAAGTGYDATNSSGSNLSVTSKAQMETVRTRAQAAGATVDHPVPADLVTASGSGLDPHLSPEAARYQLPRVAKARHLSVESLETLIDAHTEPRSLGVFGQARVNVLKLNLALDALQR